MQLKFAKKNQQRIFQSNALFKTLILPLKSLGLFSLVSSSFDHFFILPLFHFIISLNSSPLLPPRKVAPV